MGKKSKQKALYNNSSNSKSISIAKNQKGDKDTGRMIKIELDQSEESLLADIISAIEIDDYANNNTVNTDTNSSANNDEDIELYDTIMPADEKHHKSISKKKRYSDMTIHDKERFIKRLIRDDRYKRKQAEIDKKLDRYDKYIANKQTEEATAINGDGAHTYNTTVVDTINEKSRNYKDSDEGDNSSNSDDDSISIDKSDDDDDSDEDEGVNRDTKKPSPGTTSCQYY